jgi:hypothetical protein
MSVELKTNHLILSKNQALSGFDLASQLTFLQTNRQRNKLADALLSGDTTKKDR